MAHTLDPQYQFPFLKSDGQRYTRTCYWEALYVFACGPLRVLVATRIVPFSDIQEALYTAFQSNRGENLIQHLLPEAPRHSVLNLHKDRDAFVENVLSLVPNLPSEIPDEILQKSEEVLEETVSKEMIRHGIEQGLSSFAQTEADPFLAEKTSEDITTIEQNNKDTAFITHSFEIDRTIKTHIRNIMQTHLPTQALVRGNNFEFDLSCRLYSNPQYLAYIKRLVQTRGSYISPVVRDFLSFYTRCLNIRLSEIGRQDHTDPHILAKRLESALGHEKNHSHHYLAYHDLTLLGTVIKGSFTSDSHDPDYTGNTNFKLSPQTDPQHLLLQEITDPVQRFIMRKFIEHTFNAHHNIRNMRYIDEDEVPQLPENPTPDPIEQKLTHLSHTFETYLNNNRDTIVKTALTGVIFALVVILFIMLFFTLKLSTS